jgi:hypothetical protein
LGRRRVARIDGGDGAIDLRTDGGLIASQGGKVGLRSCDLLTQSRRVLRREETGLQRLGDEEVLVDDGRRAQQVRGDERRGDQDGDAAGAEAEDDPGVAPGPDLAEELRRGPGRVRPAA